MTSTMTSTGWKQSKILSKRRREEGIGFIFKIIAYLPEYGMIKQKWKMENPIIIYIPFSYQKMEAVDGVVDKSYWRGI